MSDPLAGLPRRRVVVVSDRYPPDTAGGAERSLHLALRKAPLRDQVLVVTFDPALDGPARRALDGVEVLALPAPAAWPLHRMSQHAVDALKRRPFGLKWLAFAREAFFHAIADPAMHGVALVLHLTSRPSGGVAMDHAAVPGERMERDLAAVLDRVRPDLVHADNARAILVAAGALEGRSVPLVALVRDHRFTSRRFDQTLDLDEPVGIAARRAAGFAGRALAFRQARLARADWVLATSRHMLETLRPFVDEERLARLPLVPVAAGPGPGAPQGAARFGRGAFKILVVGGLTANKGQTHLLDAWDELAARIPNVELVVAGDGPSRGALEKTIAAKGLGERVRLVGHMHEAALAALYAACDVVALPTLWPEPFGRVPLEAGAAGRAVVAYASGGLAETVVDGVTGRLVATGDRAAFLEALGVLADDPAARVRMGDAGRTAAAAFAPGPLAERLAAIWDGVIAASGNGSRPPGQIRSAS